MSELSELYTSISLKTFAISMIGVFVPIYLYQLGYGLVLIALYFTVYFIFRIGLNILAGEVVARYGPKHTISYGYVLVLVYLGMLLTLPQYGWPLWLLALVAATEVSFNFVAVHVDFSKIKESENVGAELSHMYLLNKIASATGPLLGGLVAVLFGIQVAIIMSIVVLMFAIWPLMLSSEPTRTKQKVDYRAIKLNSELKNITSLAVTSISRQVNISLWPLYISIFIFSENVYGMVGLVTSIAVVSSILMAKIFGKIIDDDKGGSLLTISAWFSAFISAMRVAVSSALGVVTMNVVSEFSDTGVLLPLTKGFYDQADTSGGRIAYIAIMESSIAFFRAFFWLTVAMLFANFDPQKAFFLTFILVAVISPLITLQNFKALRTNE